MTLALEARNIYRFFRVGTEETLALQGVSLHVRRGETVAVEGPSGSGKSTLLACLAGIDEPAAGSVSVGGQIITYLSEAQRSAVRARRIGILLQTQNLLPHLNVIDNIRLVQRAGRGPGLLRPEELIDQVGLGGRAVAWAHQLSGGELQRAGLAVALANGPDVLLADEPTGELDGQTEAQILALLRRHASAGTGLLIVTHSRDVTASADRVLTLDDGRIAS